MNRAYDIIDTKNFIARCSICFIHGRIFFQRRLVATSSLNNNRTLHRRESCPSENLSRKVLLSEKEKVRLTILNVVSCRIRLEHERLRLAYERL